jgi:hypothetical protein
MAKGPSVLIVDDGELEDVREILDALDVEYGHLRGGAVPRRLEPPALLFVATARRAALAASWTPRARGGPVKIAVAAEDSNALRESLRQQGFDYLVRSPVHREALRLLLLRALYTGEERRRDARYAIGCEVQCRTGLRRRTATLIELSASGARLLASQPLGLGSRLTLELPPALAGEGAWIRARVLRVREGARPRPGEYTVALAFEPLRAAQERALRTALARCAEGPIRGVGAPAAARLPAAGAGAPADRRKDRRAAFASEVETHRGEARRVWIGRDISAGGMRIEPDPDVAPGQSFDLAIYGEAGEPPIAARARALRNDGPAGVALRFEGLTPAARRRLEALVARLPAVEPLQGGECAALGSVVSRVLEAEVPEAREGTA